MWNFKQQQSTYGLGLILSVFMLVLLAHLSAIQAVLNGFLRVNVMPSTVFTTRMIEPVLQIESIRAQVTPSKVAPKVTSKVTPKPPDPRITTQTAESIVKDKTDMQQSEAPQSPVSAENAKNEANTISPDVSDKAVSNQLAEDSSIPNESAASPPTTATAYNTPQTAIQVYDVTFTRNGNSNYGQAELYWQHDGSFYKLSLVARYFGMDIFEQKSQGNINATGLQPIRYSDKRYRKSEVATHFNHELGKITFSANTHEAVLLNGAQDRLSVILQLAGMLAADPTRYGTGSTLSLQVASDKLAEPWVFAIENLETLNVGQGQSIARKVTRNPRREFDQKVELWFATENNYSPVRFRFTETNGDFVDAVLKLTNVVPLKVP